MKNAYTSIPTKGVLCKYLYLKDLEKSMGLVGKGLEWLRLHIVAKYVNSGYYGNA